MSRIHHLHKKTYASETSQDHEDSVHQNSQINSDFFQPNSVNIHSLSYEYFYGLKQTNYQSNSILMVLYLDYQLLHFLNCFLLFLFSLFLNYIFQQQHCIFHRGQQKFIFYWFAFLCFYSSAEKEPMHQFIFFLIWFFPPCKNKSQNIDVGGDIYILVLTQLYNSSPYKDVFPSSTVPMP